MYSGTINNQIIKHALVEILGATLDRNGLPSAKKSVWYEKSKLYIAVKKNVLIQSIHNFISLSIKLMQETWN